MISGSQSPPRIYFYPRPPGGGRRLVWVHIGTATQFLSTPSGWRATAGPLYHAARRVDFYPRPPGGGRQRAPFFALCSICHFYPRPPGGGRLYSISAFCEQRYFYPRPPGGGRLTLSASEHPAAAFLSTPSGWRATGCMRFKDLQAKISIHALRVEGDLYRRRGFPPRHYFYPRPPGGGRHCLIL